MSKRRRKSTSAIPAPDQPVAGAECQGLDLENVVEASAPQQSDLRLETKPVEKSRMSIRRSAKPAPVDRPAPSDSGEALSTEALSAEVLVPEAVTLNPEALSLGPEACTQSADGGCAAPLPNEDSPVSEYPDSAAPEATAERALPAALLAERANTVPEPQPRLGARLRAAREARGISREDMARRLRVSPTVVSDLESENWARLGASVYVRGHLKNYARLVDLPQVAVTHAVQRMAEAGPLLPSLPAAAGDTWLRRNRNAFTYLVYVLLTLMLAIPTYTMLNNRGINSPEPLLANRSPAPSAERTEIDLRPAISSQSEGATASMGFEAEPEPVAEPTPLPAGPAPMMASMTPLAEPSMPLADGEGRHRLRLRFSGQSWVELLDGNGRRLEYGILGAGEAREYRVDGPVSLSVGNVSAVTLDADGAPVDLTVYARQNVARLKLFEGSPENSAPRR